MEIVRSVTNGSRASARWFLPALLAVLGFAGIAAAMAQGGEEGEVRQRLTGERFDASGAHRERTSLDDQDSVRGQIVLGPVDRRTRISETHEFPFSSIAYLELYNQWGYSGDCTGTFIGPDVLLTAAHCLYDSVSGWTTGIAVVPGKDGPAEPHGYEWAASWWVPDPWITTGAPAWDWGIIRLDGSHLASHAGYLTVGVLTTATLRAPTIGPAIVGYPGEMPIGTMWGQMTDAFASVGSFQLTYDIDTTAGMSGAPIWLLGDGPHLGTVVGVHTHGGFPYNSGSRIDYEFLQNILDGCWAMGCSIAYYIEDSQPPPTNTPIPQATATNTPIPQATATNTPAPQATATPTDIPVTQPTETVPPPPDGDQPFDQLHFRWSLVPWMQDDAPIGEALAAAGLSDVVTAIYTWRADSQSWEAYFPAAAGIPGANDFETFEHGTGYWIAISEPVDLPAPTATPAVPPTATATPSEPPISTPTPFVPPTATNTPSEPPTSTPTPFVPPTATNTPFVPPTATNTPFVPPTATPVPSNPANMAQLWQWYDDVGELGLQHGAIVDDAQAGVITRAAAAPLLAAVSDAALALHDHVESQASARQSWPQICQDAADWVGLSAGWQHLLSGYWALLYFEWPYGDYFDQIDQAIAGLYVSRSYSVTTLFACEGL